MKWSNENSSKGIVNWKIVVVVVAAILFSAGVTYALVGNKVNETQTVTITQEVPLTTITATIHSPTTVYNYENTTTETHTIAVTTTSTTFTKYGGTTTAIGTTIVITTTATPAVTTVAED